MYNIEQKCSLLLLNIRIITNIVNNILITISFLQIILNNWDISLTAINTMIYLKVVETILAITIYCTYASQVNTPVVNINSGNT